MDANIADYLKKAVFLGSESVNMLMWGGSGRARGQNSLQRHFYCILFVFIIISFHCAFTFMRF